MKITQNQLKLLTSLKQKKYRIKHGLFVVEGIKTVNEFLNSDFQLHSLYTTDLNTYSDLSPISLTNKELLKASSFKNPNKVIAVFNLNNRSVADSSNAILALDDVNDPGNLGTIIRLCDWFGITTIKCSLNTVDCFNPKVIQASMGSLTRVNIEYVELGNFLENNNQQILVSDMEGENIYNFEFPKNSIIVMGNEANGVSETIKKIANHKISIPRFSKHQRTESLNVAMATSILLSEFRRKTTEKKN